MNPFVDSKKYFKSPLQEFVFFDKYSRFNYALGRRETWIETVDRTVDFLKELSHNKLLPEDYDRIRKFILEMKVMPSMRLLAMAGEAARRNNICLYNCSFMGVNDIRAFAEALYISISGCGVGFSVEHKHINRLPLLPKRLIYVNETHAIEDTSEGWYWAIFNHIHNLYEGRIIDFDYSYLRPAGAILKTKGGRASGPQALQDCIWIITSIFTKAVHNRQNKLKSIQVHDIMCAIGQCAVSGGVRRTAMISLFDFDDKEMRYAKTGKFPVIRYNANNSNVIPINGITQEEFDGMIDVALDGGYGEPGIFNLQAIRNTTVERRKKELVQGVNPSLRAGTSVLTTDGIVNIESLENKEFKIRNYLGEIVEAKCFLSGKNQQLYKITLSNGIEYFCTKEHKWPIIENGNIKKYTTDLLKSSMLLPVQKNKFLDYGDIGTEDEGFLLGWLTGDGWVTIRSDNGKRQVGFVVAHTETYIKDKLEGILNNLGSNAKFSYRNNGAWEINLNNNVINLLLDKYGYKTKSDGIPDKIWTSCSEEFRRGYIDGLFSSDGSVEKFGKRVSFQSVHKKLINDVEKLLGFYGIVTHITYRKIESPIFPNKKIYDREYGIYQLRFSRYSDVRHFSEIFPLTHTDKLNKLLSRSKNIKTGYIEDTIAISSVEKTDIYEDVWDISVQDNFNCFQLNSSLTGNCGEIMLRDMQLCNLSSVICREDDTFDSLGQKIVVASIIGTIQSMATHFPLLRPEWRLNCQEERLLGVSLNGQMDCPIILNDRDNKLKEYLKETALLANKIFAIKLNINSSASVTCVKPEGNSSQLLGCSSGAHPRYSKYYIRRVRVDVKSPIYEILFSAGVPLVPENGQDWSNIVTAVASFPIKSPENSIVRDDLTAVEFLEYWKQLKLNYTEHNPSITIYVKDNEKEEVKKWVWDNLNIINGMTLLPFSDHKYENAPYEEITEEQYEAMIKTFPNIDWSLLEDLEYEDHTTSSQELACMGGSCNI